MGLNPVSSLWPPNKTKKITTHNSDILSTKVSEPRCSLLPFIPTTLPNSPILDGVTIAKLVPRRYDRIASQKVFSECDSLDNKYHL